MSALHLHAGPIDLVCRAWGAAEAVRAAYDAASGAFPSILPGLCAELPLLRAALPGPRPLGAVGRAMHEACLPYAGGFITPMAAVAGAVADAVLAVMCGAAPLERALVNNRGDIAVHLVPGQSMRCGVVTDVAAPALDGVFTLHGHEPSRGVATSGRACRGRGGRSFSFGIADSATVLARGAAEADAAASVVGNAVDLPGHPAVVRVPADSIDGDSDLGSRLVTWDVGALAPGAVAAALDNGARVAQALIERGRIHGAVLSLRGQVRVCGRTLLQDAA